MGKKIVIYSAANAHGYFMSIVHRMIYNADAFAVYIGDNGTVNRAGGIELFDDNILYKQICGRWGDKNYFTAEEYEKYLLEYFDSELNKHEIDIEKVSEFYIGSYWSDFPIYINLKGIKHYVFEETIGDMALPTVNSSKGYPQQLALRQKLHMLDGIENENIIAACSHPRSKGMCGDKFIAFDLIEGVKKLSETNKNILSDVFQVPRIFESNRHVILLLTQWFNRGGGLWDSLEVIKMYSMLVDLYTKGLGGNYDLIIKPHPADPLRGEYEKYLNCIMIGSKYPSDFFGLISNLNVDIALTVQSTSIYSAEGISKKQVSVKCFTEFYSIMPSFYAALRLIKLLGVKCYHFGVFNSVIVPLLALNSGYLPDDSQWLLIDKENPSENSGVVLYDYIWNPDIKQTQLSRFSAMRDDTVVFIITDNIQKMIKTNSDYKCIEDIYAFKLSIKPLKENGLFKAEDKMVYLYCRNKDYIDKIKSYKFIDIFQNSNIVIEKYNCDESIVRQQIMLDYIAINISKE